MSLTKEKVQSLKVGDRLWNANKFQVGSQHDVFVSKIGRVYFYTRPISRPNEEWLEQRHPKEGGTMLWDSEAAHSDYQARVKLWAEFQNATRWGSGPAMVFSLEEIQSMIDRIKAV